MRTVHDWTVRYHDPEPEGPVRPWYVFTCREKVEARERAALTKGKSDES